MKFTAEFDNQDLGVIELIEIESNNLEDATIAASNIEDEKGWEFLGIDSNEIN